jgi:hypothetical protein
MFSGIEDFERAIGYESPITQIIGQLETQMEDDCIKVVQQCGFDVNKEELARALVYDREQYDKGYADGYTKSIDDFAGILKERWIETDDLSISSEFFEFVDDVTEQLKAGTVDG